MPFRRSAPTGGYAPTLSGILTGQGYRVIWLSDGRRIKGTVIPGGTALLLNGGTGTTGTVRGRNYLATLSTAGFNDGGVTNYASTDYWYTQTVADSLLDPLNNALTAVQIGTLYYYSSPGVPFGTYNGYPDGHGVHWGNAADLQIAVGSVRAFNSGVTFGARINNVGNNHGFTSRHAGTNGSVISQAGGGAYSSLWAAQGANMNRNDLYYLTAWRISPGAGLKDVRQIAELNTGSLAFGTNAPNSLTAPVGAFTAPSVSPIIQIGPCYQGNVFPSMNKRTRTMITVLVQGYISNTHLETLFRLTRAGLPG